MRRVAIAQDRDQPPQQDVVDHGDAVGQAHRRRTLPRRPPDVPRRRCTRLAPVSSPRRNVELKATDPDPERSLAVCRDLGAEDRGILVQRDTYFRVGDGRLKLREETPGGAALIQYHRSDRPEARESRYRIAPVEDGAALREALDAALGTLVVVDKERRLLLWEGVRIHLDTVEGLGSFLELEGVAPEGSDLSAEHDRVAQLSEALGIDESRILVGLLLGPGARAGRQRGADRGGARRDGAGVRAVLQLPRRRRAAGARRVDPRRRQRRERRLPAGQLRRGVGDRRADRGGPQPDRRGGRDRRRGGAVRALRRLPPAPARVHAARRHCAPARRQGRPCADDARGAVAAILRTGVPRHESPRARHRPGGRPRRGRGERDRPPRAGLLADGSG